jgi:hypothetical protein
MTTLAPLSPSANEAIYEDLQAAKAALQDVGIQLPWSGTDFHGALENVYCLAAPEISVLLNYQRCYIYRFMYILWWGEVATTVKTPDLGNSTEASVYR